MPGLYSIFHCGLLSKKLFHSGFVSFWHKVLAFQEKKFADLQASIVISAA
jgi:hypothetical protein